MEALGTISVGAITVICYVIAQLAKASRIDNKWIPLICMVSGGLLGVLGRYLMVDYPADDIITAIAIGIVSGGSATGVNQVYKQLSAEDKIS